MSSTDPRESPVDLEREAAIDDSKPTSKNANATNPHADSYYDDSDTSLGAKWSRAVLSYVHQPITKLLLAISRTAANNPKTVVSSVMLFSFAIVVVGLFTNFYFETNEQELFSPARSRPKDHRDWIEKKSGFPLEPRYFLMTVHTDGDNVLSADGVARVFQAVDVVRNTPGYSELCEEGRDITVLDDGSTTATCRINAVTSFWNDSTQQFQKANLTDQQVLEAMSVPLYPDGTGVDIEGILGTIAYDENNVLNTARVFLVRIDLPDTDGAEDFEEQALENVFDLQDEWDADSNTAYELEVFAERSFADEFSRAILSDIPLVPLVFTIMSIFTCAIFYKKNRVKSQSTLGFGAVVAVTLSIMTGYGLLFTIGVPFTSMTQILPFIIFGVGMDSAYILAGSFERTDNAKSIEERVDETVKDVGVSIALTTTTSAVAFGLGCTSSIPAVFWLCQYAFPTIIISFLYQMTFFIALIVIDERRIHDKRKDCCIWVTVEQDEATDSDADNTESERDSTADRFMIRYADFLLRPWVKIAVILAFVGLLGACAYSASLLTQEFSFTDVVPNDSYIKPYWDTYDDYTTRGGFIIEAYFRNVDQSSANVREEMTEYLNSLVAMEEVSNQPPFFWVRDFDDYVANNASLQGLTFQEQFDSFFAQEEYLKQYRDYIVVDEDNRIISSRVSFFMDNVDSAEVEDLINAITNQRDVSSKQPTNKGKENWNFFTFGTFYMIWEFYTNAVSELILTTILGIVSVTVLSLLFIPHWTGALFVAPFISILYVDLLGVLQFGGVHVNSVSYISLVMSIGLLVDFLVHILLRYYEIPGDRKTRVVEMLRTMGSSVLLGGVSTFLGVIPLAFSSSEVFSTIFITFIGLVTLGIGHGLILLPVVLSMCGPEIDSKDDDDDNDVISDDSNGARTETSNAVAKTCSEDDCP